MQLGLIGLGRMGGNMRERLRRAGHEVIGYDHHPDVTDVPGLDALVERLSAPRVVWIMVPVQFTEPTIDQLKELLSEGDIVIDGGNSRFSNDPPRAERLAERGIGYLDVAGAPGGGPWALGGGIRVAGAVHGLARPGFARFLARQGDWAGVEAGAGRANQFGGKPLPQEISARRPNLSAFGWSRTSSSSSKPA